MFAPTFDETDIQEVYTVDTVLSSPKFLFIMRKKEGDMTLGTYLLKLKEQRGTSFQEISDATGISKGTLSQITSGRTKAPDPETLRRLAVFFGKDESGAAIIYEEFMDLAGYLQALPQLTEEEILLRLRRDFPEIYRQIVDDTTSD